MPDFEETLREAQIERDPCELHEWVHHKLRCLTQTEDGKSAIRLRIGAAKKFIEEVYPLALWANRFHGNAAWIRCRHVHGDQPYDALVRDCSQVPSKERRLEITLASASYEEHLRMLYMEQHGGVPMIGEVRRVGTRRDGKIEATWECASHGQLIGEACRQVREAIARKAERRYDPETSLLVMANDDYFEVDSDFTDLDDTLLEVANGIRPAFERIFVLGWQGRVALSASAPDGEWGGWTITRD